MKFLCIISLLLGTIAAIDYDQTITLSFGIMKTIGFQEDPYELIGCLKPSIVDNWNRFFTTFIETKEWNNKTIFAITDVFIDPIMTLFMQFSHCSTSDIQKIKSVIDDWIKQPNEFINKIESNVENLKKLFDKMKDSLAKEDYLALGESIGLLSKLLFTK